MPVYFFSADFDIERVAGIERAIRAAIPDLIRIRHINEIAKNRPDSPHDTSYLLIVALADDRAAYSALIGMARDLANVFPILISDEISATDYKRLARTGNVEWVSATTAPQEILEIISHRRRDAAPRTDRRLPVIASFIPCAGGVGNTTLAVEVATFLKTSKPTAQRNICIVDLDFQTSHVCDHLDIEPRLQIEEVSNNPERLDEQLLDIYVSRHACGLHVFAAPRTKLNYCDLNLSALDALFNMISARYDVIIIDFPTTWFAWTRQIVSGSDGFIVTGLNTVPGLRQLAEMVAIIRDARHPSAPMAVAVNRCERGLLGGIARRHHVEKVLGTEKIFFIHNEPMVLESINTGTPMAISRAARKTSGEIASVARFCADLKSIRTTAARPQRAT
jgi:pilus assembly protein CpaE